MLQLFSWGIFIVGIYFLLQWGIKAWNSADRLDLKEVVEEKKEDIVYVEELVKTVNKFSKEHGKEFDKKKNNVDDFLKK